MAQVTKQALGLISTRSLRLCAAFLMLSSAVAAQRNTVIAKVPIEVVEGYVFLKARINGSEELNYLFDTGCTEATLDSSTAARFGWKTSERTRNYGQGPFVQQTVDGVDLAFGPLTLEGIDLLQRSSDFMERRLGVQIDGVVGADLLRDYVVEVDYDRMRLTVYSGDGFNYRGTGDRVEIDANRFFSTVSADLVLENGDSLPGRFLIDNGAGLALALNTPFVNDNSLVKKIGVPHIEYRLAAHDVVMKSVPGRVPTFGVGGQRFSDMPVLLSQTDVGPLSPRAIAGIIGNRIWRRFNTVFDYSRNVVHIQPNRFADTAFRVDCSGLGLEMDARGKVVVTGVIDNSPGARASVMEGDIVLALDGRGVAGCALSEMRGILSRDREAVSLLVERGGEHHRLSLTLRALY